MTRINKIPEELLCRILKKALSGGGDYADVFVERMSPLFIQLEDNRIEKLSSGTDSGVGVRVIKGEMSAYAYSNDFTEEALLGIASSVSRAIRDDSGAGDLVLDMRKLAPDVEFRISQRPDSVDTKKKIEIVELADRVARKVSPKVRQVTIIYRDSVQNVTIAASDGTFAEDERIHTVAIVQVVAAEGDVIQTGYEPVGGLKGFELFDENPIEEVAVRVAEKAVAMLRARKAPGGRMPVVISSSAGGTMIHEAVGHGLEADLARQGISVYSGRIGERIASPLVTIIDDSTLQGRRGSFRFDDEGIPSSRTILVSDGVLKGYMHDRLTAMCMGCEPTGNGRRQSYRYRPIPRMTNTFIQPGTDDPESIIRSVEKGFFVKKMGGGQVNTVTGEFVFEVSEGFMIEKGKVGEAVRGATLTGNGPEVLLSIDKVGSDLGFAIGTCGKDSQGAPVSDAMPTVRIPEMVVGGEV
jgi:TldD protein